LEESQKKFLQEAKRRLRAATPGLTWDDLAKLALIEPRALKTYRMPEGSPDYREMPRLVWSKIEDLIRETDIPSAPGSNEGTDNQHARQASFEATLAPALAALVVRQARVAIVEGRPVSGVDRYVGDQIGLTREDRHAMALVSRARLSQGLSDIGAEIHEVLAHCLQPLGEWLPLPSIHAERLTAVALLDPDGGVPTREAEELAQRFATATASIEELLFSRFQELLAKGSRLAAAAVYTRVREFVVRHPIATHEQLRELLPDVPSTIGVLIQQEFYEPVPDGWGPHETLTICGHCGNALRKAEQGFVCRTKACAEALPAEASRQQPLADSLRLTRGLRQYWQEPGFDELRVFDELCHAGLQPVLYPQLDRVDIEVGEVGIDLKAYVSPELLASRLNRNLGGLAHYRHKWLVVPDRLVQRIPAYLERLRTALQMPAVRVLATTSVLRELSSA
jgi:hypothetical protein